MDGNELLGSASASYTHGLYAFEMLTFCINVQTPKPINRVHTFILWTPCTHKHLICMCKNPGTTAPHSCTRILVVHNAVHKTARWETCCTELFLLDKAKWSAGGCGIHMNTLMISLPLGTSFEDRGRHMRKNISPQRATAVLLGFSTQNRMWNPYAIFW